MRERGGERVGEREFERVPVVVIVLYVYSLYII